MASKEVVILLNDNDVVLTRVSGAKFKKEAGWDSLITTSFDEALDLIKDKDPDILITEIIINDEKGRSGFDLIEEVKKLNNDCIVVILTDLTQDNDRERALELGVDHYFVKSDVSIKSLIAKLKEIID